MVDRKVVPFDEFYYQLKLMYLFLLHVVCIMYSRLTNKTGTKITQSHKSKFTHLHRLITALS
jgi:hypothetical protein